MHIVTIPTAQTKSATKDPTRERTPSPSYQSLRSALWIRNISSIDQRLGVYAENVRSLLHVQTLVLERQDWAKKVLEVSSRQAGYVDYPVYVLNPLHALSQRYFGQAKLDLEQEERLAG